MCRVLLRGALGGKITGMCSFRAQSHTQRQTPRTGNVSGCSRRGGRSPDCPSSRQTPTRERRASTGASRNVYTPHNSRSLAGCFSGALPCVSARLFLELSGRKSRVEDGFQLLPGYQSAMLVDVSVELLLPTLLQGSRTEHVPLGLQLLLAGLHKDTKNEIGATIPCQDPCV